MSNRRLGLVGVLLLTLLIVAACGGSNDSEAENAGASEASGDGQAVAAADETNSSDTEFEAAVRAARDEAQSAIDEANRETDAASQGLGLEAFMTGPLAANLGEMVTLLNGYLEELQALEAPAEYETDVTRQLTALEELIDLTEEELAAAAAGDDARASELFDQRAELLAVLAADLSPEYAEFAFVSPLEADFVSLFGELNEEELAYLEAVREAGDEFNRRAADFGRAIGRQYTTPEALLLALSEAGAGTAFEAVQTAAQALDPPGRFQNEHDLWLAMLDEQVRLDRLIGDAARAGDAAGFVANNMRLGLITAMFPEAPEGDPAFVAAQGRPTEMLDSSTAIAQTSYGTELYVALRLWAAIDPPSAVFGSLNLPLPDEASMAAIEEVGPELIDAVESSRSTIFGLEAPAEYTADHLRIIQYFDEIVVQAEAVIQAAVSGDAETVRAERPRQEEIYCGARADLSEDIAPATDVFFEQGAAFCMD